jgi:hypothetical protein
MPEALSTLYQVRLRIDEKVIPLSGTKREFSLRGYVRSGNNLVFELEYLGDKPLVVFQMPRLKILGLRHTIENELKKIGVLIGEMRVGLRVANFSAPEGEWVDMDLVIVDEGGYAIQVQESPYFRIKTLLLETDTPLPWPQEAEEQVEATPFWKRMVLLGVKFLIVVTMLFMIYLFRSRIWTFLGAIFRPIRNLLSRTYWQLPDLAWTILWAVVGVGLYGTSLAVTANGENYGFTFGGFAMVFVIWHLSRVLKTRFSEHFPKAAEYIYRSRSTPFFALAIGLLVVTAVLLVVKLEPVAEQVAVIVYYLLVVGVVGELISLRRRKEIGGWGSSVSDRGKKLGRFDFTAETQRRQRWDILFPFC